MQQIDHVIVLVLENRSFDHMLGYLPHPKADFVGVGKMPNPPTKATSRFAIYPGPGHSHADVMEQIYGKRLEQLTHDAVHGVTNTPDMSGFGTNYDRYASGCGSKVLRCFDSRMVPVLSMLALEYAVCDRWFCALPGETFPNRDFIHSGTSVGEVSVKKKPLHQRCVYRMLDEAGASWKVYHRGVAHVLLYDYVRQRTNNIKSLNTLLDDIHDGTLPNYSFVEPDYGILGRGNSQHPSQARSREEFVDGEDLIATIYNELRANMKVFKKTAFVITYDEHGGFYDHVPPMPAARPDDSFYNDDGYRFGFDVHGPRVPGVVISPWIPKNTIDHTGRDHSCIPETLRRRFSPNSKPLTTRVGAHLGGLFTLANPRELPDLPEARALTYEQAENLETAICGEPDARDLSKELDVRLQTTMRDVGNLLAKISGTDFPFGV